MFDYNKLKTSSLWESRVAPLVLYISTQQYVLSSTKGSLTHVLTTDPSLYKKWPSFDSRTALTEDTNHSRYLSCIRQYHFVPHSHRIRQQWRWCSPDLPIQWLVSHPLPSALKSKNSPWLVSARKSSVSILWIVKIWDIYWHDCT